MSDEITALLKAQIGLLKTIAQELARLNASKAPLSPGYRRQLSEFPGFDWSSIGAQVIAQDAHGVSEVEWNAHRFTRRSGSGKFGQAIWFSRPLGRDDNETSYARLITFKASQAEPLPADLQAKPQPAGGQPKAQPASPPSQAPPPGNGQANGQTAPVTGDSATAYWTLAGALIQAGKLDHPQAGTIAKGSGTWAEKAARLIKEFGPVA